MNERERERERERAREIERAGVRERERDRDKKQKNTVRQPSSFCPVGAACFGQRGGRLQICLGICRMVSGTETIWIFL